MKFFTTAILAATVLATSAFAEDAQEPLEPFLTTTLGVDTALEDGADIYNYWCAACHLPGKPGSVALMVIHEAPFPTNLPDQEGLDADYVRYLVRNGQSAMPRFRKTQISEAQLDALANYLAGNDN